jgi:antitoxin component of RelBE/YafQ-DinJ toxin-antitoxin module
MRNRSVYLYVRIDEATSSRLDAVTKALGMSKSDVVNMLLDQALDEVEKTREVRLKISEK